MIDNIQDFKNIHKGKRAIVCGAGPSVNDINFDLISPDENIIFACNQSVTALSRCDYFCIADNANVVLPFFLHGIDIATKVVAIGNFYSAEHLASNCANAQYKKELVHKLHNKIHILPRGEGDSLAFSKSGPIIRGPAGEDVIHVTSHFAYIMGCKEIVLAGVDLTVNNGIYCNPTTYKKEVDWSGVAPVNNPQWLDASYNTWLKVKEINSNIKFLDASPRGRLNEIFDSIPIESLYS